MVAAPTTHGPEYAGDVTIAPPATTGCNARAVAPPVTPGAPTDGLMHPSLISRHTYCVAAVRQTLGHGD